MACEPPLISIKLLIDPETNRVVLAEAGKDFVDTLRGLLMFPLGNIVRLVDKHQVSLPCCLNNLYKSVENLSLNSFRTDACKAMLLCPRSIHEDKLKTLNLSVDDVTEPTKYFVCEKKVCRQKAVGWLSYYKTSRCTCGKLMNTEAVNRVVRNPVKEETRGESMFFITDGLRLMHGVPTDLIQTLLKMSIKNVSQIVDKVVKIGTEEMANLLSPLLTSKTTLTDVFLRKNGIPSSTLMLDEQFVLVGPNVKGMTNNIGKERAGNDGRTSVKIMLRKSDTSKDDLPVESIFNLFEDLNTFTKKMNTRKGVLPPFYSCPNEFPSVSSRGPPTYYCYSVPRPNGLNYYLTCSNNHISRPLRLLDPKSLKPNTTNSSGYVEKNSVFVVTDDLVVKSLSSSVSLLKEIGISLDDVEEKVINIGEVEALTLLRACLCSSSALSALLKA
ncbi:hypothetical protein V6N13_126740 [Hibiscus sabdariffa]|uniref:DUF674 family protein n=1 Tax=Hibiscus sabdariffa TaxID=183260 RepID=A0ABR2RET7_9ROSI